ncbi:hypothetical protein BDA99DRAFT_554285 [Phascolomyces articulosus]|uniref:Uncharacterized protein n=1 Tax=Phascolomyces articulosus TaxID=60185 RepID=A0AAD5PKN0_9FUNG|nr:hypothetical protein BDA99DRAFT_554285 [Phascolomyces articulosus]
MTCRDFVHIDARIEGFIVCFCCKDKINLFAASLQYLGKVFYYIEHKREDITRILAVVGVFKTSVDTSLGSMYTAYNGFNKPTLHIVDIDSIMNFAGVLTWFYSTLLDMDKDEVTN